MTPNPLQPGITAPGEPLTYPVVYFDEFLTAGYLPNTTAEGKFSETADKGEWLVTVTDGGTDNAETITIADDLHGGYLKVLNNDADNDVVSMQKNGETFKLAAGRTTTFEIKVRVTDVSETDWFFGLAITDVGVLAACTDLIGFRCPDSTGDIDAVTCKDSTETVTDTGVDLADATDVVLRVEVDGISKARFYVDGVLKATHALNLPDDETLTPTLEIRNDGAAAQSFLSDYLLVLAER